MKWRLTTGRVVRLHPGVYYFNATPPTWRSDVLAGVLAAGSDALASHRCAAVLYGLDAIYGKMIEVTVPYEESPIPGGVILHRTRRANPVEVVDGIPVTTIEKSLLDLASQLSGRVLYKAALSAIRLDQTTPEKLDLAIGIYGGRGVKGTRAFRSIVRMVANDRSASVAEVDLAEIIADAGVPRPVQQLRVLLPTGTNVYPDFAWPDLMRIVEADSVLAHSSPEQLESDLVRQNALMDLGWEIRRFTASQIRNEPLLVREEVERFINKPVL